LDIHKNRIFVDVQVFEMEIDVSSLLPVTPARPRRRPLSADAGVRYAEWSEHAVDEVTCIGNACAPRTGAAALYAGHRAARQFDSPTTNSDDVPFRLELRFGA